jgi:hypothetical protein
MEAYRGRAAQQLIRQVSQLDQASILNGRRLSSSGRKRGGFVWQAISLELDRLNLPGPDAGQGRHHRTATALSDYRFMKTIRPDNAESMPLRHTPPRVGTILIRFIGLLVLAVVVLTLAWSR